MSQNFGNMGEIALHFASAHVAVLAEVQKGLKRAAIVIEKESKDSIGVYQEAIGPFPAWEPLADSTEAEKAAHGYPSDAPLLRTGEMRDSISHELDGLEAAIGSDSEKMVYHEFGTQHIPPRPVLGPATLRKMEVVQKLLGAGLMSGLVGGQHVHKALGYDQEIS